MSFTKKVWHTGDKVHAADINRVEDGIELAHDLIALIPDPPDLSDLALKSEIPNITNLATKAEVAEKVGAADVQDAINAIPPIDLSIYASKSYVTAAINQAVIDGSDVDIDLTPYALKTEVSEKVDKVTGKGLSTNDFTNALKSKLEGLSNYDDSTINTALSGKVDKEVGKGLSSNDFTSADKLKLQGIEVGAQKNPDLSGYALKTEVNAVEIPVKVNGVSAAGMRIECFDVVVTTAGTWSINISSAGFTQPPRIIGVAAYQSGTNLTGRRSVGITTKTKDVITGFMMSGTAVGLIGNGLTEETGSFELTLLGK